MKNLKEIIESLKIIRTETKSKVEDSIVWVSAVKIFISKDSKENKFNYTKSPKNNSYTKKDQEPTAKQLWRLKKEGVEIPAGLTKKQAGELIDNLK